MACLRQVPVIFCEDTRVTGELLRRLGIRSTQQLYRMDQHQEKRSFSQFDAVIETGDVAFVSDAGSPGVSDPGAALVAHARSKQIAVHVLPGASALTAFISGCGVVMSHFYFGGFLSKKAMAMRREIDECIHHQRVGVWFESPRRIQRVMSDLNDRWPMVPVVLVKELTKPHELYFRGVANEVYDTLLTADLRGEWMLLLDARSVVPDLTQRYQAIAEACHRAQLTGAQVKQLAPWFDCSKNELYDVFQAL